MRERARAEFLEPISRQLREAEIDEARLNKAMTVQDMGLPGYRLHPLKGERAGFWAVSLSGNWRITFRLENGHAYDVDLIDYH